MHKLLLFLSLIHHGDWKNIYSDICKKTNYPMRVIEETTKSCKSECVSVFEDKYPANLHNTNFPPFVLYYYGNYDLLNTKSIISLFDSTKILESIFEIAKNIIDDLACNDYCFCITPKQTLSKKLINYINERGYKLIIVLEEALDSYLHYLNINPNILIISEYPDNIITASNTRKYASNRIVAAISHAGLLVASKRDPDVLSLLESLLDRGRQIFVVPLTPYVNCFNNSLIKEGATLVESGLDIRENI